MASFGGQGLIINPFSLYYYLIPNSKKKVHISDVSNRIPVLGIFRFTGRNAKVLTPKKLYLLFFTFIFFITHLCFFNLKLTKTYFDLRK